MFFVVLIILFTVIFWLGPKIIKIFGNETFDENKVTGRTVRKTPEQKALRFKFYIAGLFIVILLIGIVIKSCSY
jgi:hypothetical protein